MGSNLGTGRRICLWYRSLSVTEPSKLRVPAVKTPPPPAWSDHSPCLCSGQCVELYFHSTIRLQCMVLRQKSTFTSLYSMPVAIWIRQTIIAYKIFSQSRFSLQLPVPTSILFLPLSLIERSGPFIFIINCRNLWMGDQAVSVKITKGIHTRGPSLAERFKTCCDIW